MNERLPPEEQLKIDEAEFIRRRNLFEPMVKTEAWKELERILLAQHAGQLQNLLAPPQVLTGEACPDGMSQTMRSEYIKGVVFGIQLTLKTPYGTIASANEIISNRQQKEKINGSEQQRSSGFDDDGNRLPDHTTVTDLGGE